MKTSSRVSMAAGGFAVLAASAFIVIRVGAHATSPITLAGLRFFAASIGFLLLSFLRPDLVRRHFQRKDIPLLLLTGATGAVIYSLALFKGQQTASAGTASLIGATIPIWASVIAVTIGRERLGSSAWLGVGLAFLGTLVITVDPSDVGRFDIGAAFVLIAALSNAVYFVAVKKLVLRYGPLSAVAGTLWAGSILFLPFVFWMDAPSTWSMAAITSALFLGLVATLAGSSLFAYVIGKVGAARASTVVYMVAPMVVALEWITFDLRPGQNLILGGALTLTGLFLVRPRFKRETEMIPSASRRVEDEVAVRTAVPDDVPALVRLAKELAEFQDLGDRFAATEAGIRAGLFGRHRSAEALVAERANGIVGYAIIARSFSSTSGAPKLIVEDAFVAASERGCGAGSALFRAIALRAREMGACRAEWTVMRDNQEALEFYKKFGARPSAEWVTCTIESHELDELTGSLPHVAQRGREFGSRTPKPSEIPGRPAECF